MPSQSSPWLPRLFAASAYMLLALFVVFPRSAGAAPQDAPTAEALFQSGKEAIARGDLAVACARFAESVRLDPAVGGFLNLADCEARLGKLASALAHFQEARDRIPLEDYRFAYAVDRIAALNPRVPRLTIRVGGDVQVDTVQVLRDETLLGAAAIGLALPVDPGTHAIVLRVPGHADAHETVTLGEGEEKSVDLVAGPLSAPPVHPSASPMPAPSPSPLPPKASTRGRTQRTVALALGGLAVTSLATGGVFALVAKSTYDDARSSCPNGPSSCTADGASGGQRAYTEAAVASVTVVAGSALAAGAFVLYLVAPRSVGVAPAIGKGQAALDIVGTW